MLFTKQDLENLVSSKLMAVQGSNLIHKKNIKEINTFINSIILLETLYIDYIVTNIKPNVGFYSHYMVYTKPIEVNGSLYYMYAAIKKNDISIEIEDCIGDIIFYEDYIYKTLSELVNYLINSKNIIINKI